MKQAKDIVGELLVNIVDIADEQSPPTKKRITPLHDFKRSHLPAPYKGLMDEILLAATEWKMLRYSSPGISFGISGAVGTGKTTIARNLMNSADIGYSVVDRYGNEMGDHRIVAGKFFHASQLMGIMDPGHRIVGDDVVGRASLQQVLRGIQVVVVDDIGTEEIPFKTTSDAAISRQNRYGEFLDYCYEHRISVVITSMIPLILVEADGKGYKRSMNPEFINIIGKKGMDRFWEMAHNYIFTLPEGFPSYRRQGGTHVE